ncbi:MAG: ABC transporter substrate-binding protein [Pseudomonadota bacterium]
MRPALAETPQRIVSLNMCTDQLVLALADREQIAGLSRFAGDVTLSHAAAMADGFPHFPAAAEAVIALEPDLVLAGRFTNRAAKDMLRRFDYRVEEVPFVRSLDDAREVIGLVADMVGHPQRGEALIEAIDQALEAERAEPDLSALIIQRRGYATGSATLTGELMSALGIRLASDDLVGARGGFADLETIIQAEPDVLVVSQLGSASEDQGTALLAHSALEQRYPASQRMELPERLTVCPGPSLIDAIEHIAGERDRLLQGRLGG